MGSLPRILTLMLPLAACGPFDAETRAHRSYVRVLQPLLVENSLLAQHMLTQSAAVHNDPRLDPATLARAWSSDIVPLAEHLHGQATFAQAPEPWTVRHADLVEIWSDRAQAYRAIDESIATADIDQWKAARELADTVKLREEEWFRSTNQTLSPVGLFVDQYP